MRGLPEPSLLVGVLLAVRSAVTAALDEGARLEAAMLDALADAGLVVQTSAAGGPWVTFTAADAADLMGDGFSVQVPLEESWEDTRVVGLATLLGVPFVPAARPAEITPPTAPDPRPLAGWPSIDVQTAEHAKLLDRIGLLAADELAAVNKARAGKDWPLSKSRFDTLAQLVARFERNPRETQP